MIYLEMSRDTGHGGGDWGFSKCLWAPTRKENGDDWLFWRNVSKVRSEDLVLHLRGIPPGAFFVGFSVVANNGFQANDRPPNPGKWDFAEFFFRADLIDFTPFHSQINLSAVFTERAGELNAYYDFVSGNEKPNNIFYVRQNGRLQCLNGAYLSAIDDQLLNALFGIDTDFPHQAVDEPMISVPTAWQISSLRTRVGQARFSSSIRRLYGNRCCFPGCTVADPRFLVGSHIARWADNERLRGHMGNGLCLCLMHDKAFEIGLFTLDEKHRVFVNPKGNNLDWDIANSLVLGHGEPIKASMIKPSDDALLEHWIRVHLEP